MSNIVSEFNNFNFNNLSLAQPHAIQGGTYFTRLLNDGNQLYIQTPKCSTKQGITKTDHKIYTDLLFSQTDNHFIEWLEGLEQTLQKKIYDKRNEWFHNELDIEDIENAFTPLTRTYKSGKHYLVRGNLGKVNALDTQELKIFNDQKEPITLDDINLNDLIISIIEISGIRFSSRSFHIDLNIKHLMVVQNKSPFTSCLIKCNSKNDMNDMNDMNDVNDVNVVNDVNAVNDADIQDKSYDIYQPSKSNVASELNIDNTKTNSSLQDNKNTLKCLGNNEIYNSEILNKNVCITTPLEEIEIDFENVDDEIKLKDANEVYMQLYLQAKHKAMHAKKTAIEAFLEAKKIKNLYLLDEIDDNCDEEDDDNYSFSDK